jgi:NADPH2:quinone reductase
MPNAMVHQAGGPGSALVWGAFKSVTPGQNQVRLRQTAVGLNYIDAYRRAGLYPSPFIHPWG